MNYSSVFRVTGHTNKFVFNGLVASTATAATGHFYFICAYLCISCLQYTFEFVCCTCFISASFIS